MTTCYLSLGSNDGHRESHLIHAMNFLAEICESVYCSTPYESPALSAKKDSQVARPHYLNAVALVEYAGTPEQLEAMLKACEIMEGRTAAARSEGRVPLDIDIVIADSTVVRPKDHSLYFFRRGYEEICK
ncbi:MAG: hypothetical protein HDR80_08355 [Bacteroides sp.]|nr:hypothetical protein [Bacteroides sp.]